MGKERKQATRETLPILPQNAGVFKSKNHTEYLLQQVKINLTKGVKAKNLKVAYTINKKSSTLE